MNYILYNPDSQKTLKQKIKEKEEKMKKLRAAN